MRRTLLVAALLAAPVLALSWRVTSPGSPPGTTFVFPLSVKGKTWQTDVILNPGVKPPLGKIDDRRIEGVLTGTLLDFASQFLDLDPSGRFFLYYDGRESWRVATNANGDDTTTLTGQVANDGTFWMSGAYTPPGAGSAIGTVFLRGQVKFVRGTFDPASVQGEGYFVGGGEVGTGLDVKFKTIGGAL